ncbi:MAG TPA: hypothetical protein VGF77_04365 [Allosphingosinicella sp.]|jgi:hypothetical protein
MHPTALFPLLLAVAAGSPAKRANDPLCIALEKFRNAPLAKNEAGKEEPRTVELFWYGGWLVNMGWKCVHHADPVGKALCRALTPPPQEFRTTLPFAIMRCYGYSFPRYASGYGWSNWQSEIELVPVNLPQLRLDVFMVGEAGVQDAIRLAVIPPSYNEREHPLPNLRKAEPPSAENEDGNPNKPVSTSQPPASR